MNSYARLFHVTHSFCDELHGHLERTKSSLDLDTFLYFVKAQREYTNLLYRENRNRILAAVEERRRKLVNYKGGRATGCIQKKYRACSTIPLCNFSTGAMNLRDVQRLHTSREDEELLHTAPDTCLVHANDTSPPSRGNGSLTAPGRPSLSTEPASPTETAEAGRFLETTTVAPVNSRDRENLQHKAIAREDDSMDRDDKYLEGLTGAVEDERFESVKKTSLHPDADALSAIEPFHAELPETSLSSVPNDIQNERSALHAGSAASDDRELSIGETSKKQTTACSDPADESTRDGASRGALSSTGEARPSPSCDSDTQNGDTSAKMHEAQSEPPTIEKNADDEVASSEVSHPSRVVEHTARETSYATEYDGIDFAAVEMHDEAPVKRDEAAPSSISSVHTNIPSTAVSASPKSHPRNDAIETEIHRSRSAPNAPSKADSGEDSHSEACDVSGVLQHKAKEISYPTTRDRSETPAIETQNEATGKRGGSTPIEISSIDASLVMSAPRKPAEALEAPFSGSNPQNEGVATEICRSESAPTATSKRDDSEDSRPEVSDASRGVPQNIADELTPVKTSMDEMGKEDASSLSATSILVDTSSSTHEAEGASQQNGEALESGSSGAASLNEHVDKDNHPNAEEMSDVWTTDSEDE
ncbi:hypothetical protein CYMTET_47729 [Cymbomonas tetramitiformis]|uniref:Uncharacterized protein n=1 Tax=Cymbomonas tetramitiformis TaxID=36881 RepID=A0AAE0BVI4_9CHLO|nr:hypothetical protein CYMTET_47729 [Cymbomonas tetramitiformis]|eukprot:gene419-777_t